MQGFDERANGYVRGEGVVALLLRRLSQARAERDPIYAIIRGSAESHGGRAAGLTGPEPAGAERSGCRSAKAGSLCGNGDLH